MALRMVLRMALRMGLWMTCICSSSSTVRPLAFKDVGARFMAQLVGYLGNEGDAPLTILAATSGDTGSAVAQAFFGVPGVRTVILFPKGKVTPLQERQFTTLGGNVRVLEVDGTFDDCQHLVKSAFSDPILADEIRLSSANSINIGRLLPQIFYYVHAAAQLPRGSAPLFSVPSGKLRQPDRRVDGQEARCGEPRVRSGDQCERCGSGVFTDRSDPSSSIHSHHFERHGRRRPEQPRSYPRPL